MRIAFVDVIDWDYTAETPYRHPLGGTQSAVCYLAAALAERGHDVTMLTMTERPGEWRGVRCRSIAAVDADGFRQLDPDTCVAVNADDIAGRLRPLFSPDCKLILWTQHAADQSAIAGLADPRTVGAHDGIAFVSQWQQAAYQAAFGSSIQGVPQRVLRNAVAPAFETLWDADSFEVHNKRVPARLAYTSTPFRGLDRLLELFPGLRAVHPGIGLEVYSSMQVYHMDTLMDHQHFGHLYEQSRALEGVEYHGSCSQTELAERLRVVSILAYPNTFAETSCIAVMEAMAAGCRVVTSRLAALPETTAGYAELVSFDQPQADYQEAFVRATGKAIQQFSERDPSLEVELRNQIRYVQENCTWSRRAAEWESWLLELATG